MLLQSLLILFLFCLSAASAGALTPLACETRAEAVALIQAVCAQRADCTFEAEANLDWNTLLVDTLKLVRFYANDPEPDVRERFENWTTEYETPLVTYDNPAAVSGDCDADFETPPVQAKLVMFELMSYLDFLAESRNCADVNEVPFLHPNGSIICDCAQGKVCEATTAGRTETVLVIEGSTTLPLQGWCFYLRWSMAL